MLKEAVVTERGGFLATQVRLLSESGVKEVTLLGQNVNSYADFSEEAAHQVPEGDPFAVYAQVMPTSPNVKLQPTLQIFATRV